MKGIVLTAVLLASLFWLGHKAHLIEDESKAKAAQEQIDELKQRVSSLMRENSSMARAASEKEVSDAAAKDLAAKRDAKIKGILSIGKSAEDKALIEGLFAPDGEKPEADVIIRKKADVEKEKEKGKEDAK